MKIAVLVSGGVDSSVALKLLQEQGHDVTAFYVKIWLEDELSYLGNCPWQEDLTYVQAVCEQLKVPVSVISLQKEYWQEVVTYTLREVQAGRTPNPDILCNQRIKFGAFLKAIDDSYEKVATGHYARVAYDENGKASLYVAPDLIKDQTYFLSHLSQQQLARALFPLGDMDKAQVRALAATYNLPNKSRKDSQGICFLGTIDFSQFLKHHLGTKKGDLIEFESNNVMGKHNGYWFYTIGQRQGIGLAGGPWYVVKKDIPNNIIYISRNYYDVDKKRDTFVVEHCSWISGQAPTQKSVSVKMRHGAHRAPAQLNFIDEGTCVVKLTERDQGIAAGQFAAFYDGDRCLGSGVISEKEVDQFLQCGTVGSQNF